MEVDEIKELLRDAENCTRLTAWEEDFLGSIADRNLGCLSDKQTDVLERIRSKVYAI